MKKKISAILISAVMMIVMAVPVFATEGYTESVTADPAPGLVGGGQIVDEAGNVVETVAEGSIAITAYADKDDLTEDAKKALEDVFENVNNGEMEYPAALTDLLGTNPVVKDLFDITVANDALQSQLDNGSRLRFVLDANVAADAEFAVASYVDGQWVLADSFENNGDDTITVEMSEFGPVAVFVEVEESGEPVGGDEPAGEGDKSGNIVLPVAGGAAVAAGGAYFFLGKKKKIK